MEDNVAWYLCPHPERAKSKNKNTLCWSWTFFFRVPLHAKPIRSTKTPHQLRALADIIRPRGGYNQRAAQTVAEAQNTSKTDGQARHATRARHCSTNSASNKKLTIGLHLPSGLSIRPCLPKTRETRGVCIINE